MCWFSSQMPPVGGWVWLQPGASSRSSHGWQEPHYLSHRCYLPGSHEQGAGVTSWSWESNPCPPTWDVDVLTSRPMSIPEGRRPGGQGTVGSVVSWGQGHCPQGQLPWEPHASWAHGLGAAKLLIFLKIRHKSELLKISQFINGDTNKHHVGPNKTQCTCDL